MHNIYIYIIIHITYRSAKAATDSGDNRCPQRLHSSQHTPFSFFRSKERVRSQKSNTCLAFSKFSGQWEQSYIPALGDTDWKCTWTVGITWGRIHANPDATLTVLSATHKRTAQQLICKQLEHDCRMVQDCLQISPQAKAEINEACYETNYK